MGPGGCPLIGYKESSSCPPPRLEINQLWSNCPALIWQLKGTGWFNPTDVGNFTKDGRGYTETSLNSSNHLEFARPRKTIPTLCPWKRGNSLGNVNSKVGIWALACSLLTQEARSSCPRLASLPSKSCGYCNHDRRCFKTLFWGQTIFTSHQVKQLLNGRDHLWMSDQRILRYQVVQMENPGLTISLCEVLNPATLQPTPEGSLPFHSCLETLDHWTKARERLLEDPLTNPKEI